MSLHKPVLLLAVVLSASAPVHAAPTDVEAEAPDVKTSAQEAAAPEVGSSGAYSDAIPLELPAEGPLRERLERFLAACH